MKSKKQKRKEALERMIKRDNKQPHVIEKRKELERLVAKDSGAWLQN